MNMHASIEALHTALGDSLAQTLPALQRIEAVVQQLAEGQGALHDRIVATDDRLVDSIRRWSTQQAELTGRLSGALDRMERYAALEAKMDALAAVQGQQMDMLAQLQGSRWWKLRR
ncbi:hypothetical protein WDV90_16985 [Xanthomonas translucens pv. undulosa]